MLFLITGGTIDKQPVFLPDGTFDNDSKVFGETHIPEMLERARFTGRSVVKTLFMLDSLDMTNVHREQIQDAMEDSEEDEIILTHGTDTMPDTARLLKLNKRLTGKTIVLTGAMVPYSVGETSEVGEKSDAMFNLGNAMAYAQCLPSGIYVAMNGRPFEADNVRKDLTTGTFTTLP